MDQPGRPTSYAIPWALFPPSLDSDLEAYLARRADPDALLKWSMSPLGETSSRRVRGLVRQLASALVHQGVPIEDLDSLSKIASPERLKLGLKFVIARTGRERSAEAVNLATTVTAIARLWLAAPEECVREMRALRTIVEPHGRGDSRRPVSRLRPLFERGKLPALLRLPRVLMHEADAMHGQGKRTRGALRAQIALAIELLIVCPMRPYALLRLRTDQNIQTDTEGGQRQIFIQPPDMISDGPAALRYEVLEQTKRLLEHYLAVHHSCLEAPPSPYLFVAAEGKRPRRYGGFHFVMRKMIRTRIGVDLSPLDLRHLAGALHLMHHPGRLELVSRLLGHRSTRHTRRLFAGFVAVPMIRRYQRLVIEGKD